MKKVLQLCVVLAVFSPLVFGTTYYSTGSVDFATLSNWNSNRDGVSGGAPTDFITAGDVFVVQGTGNGGTTPHAMTLAGSLTIGTAANNTKVQIENGASVTATAALIFAAAAQFQIDNGGTYSHNHTGAMTSILGGVESFGASSNFVIGGATSPGTGPSSANLTGSFGNFIFSTASSTTMQCNDVFPNVAGNFTKSAASAEFRMAGSTAANGGFTIAGDFNLSAGIFSFGNGTVAPNLTVSGNFNMTAGTLQTACTTNPSTNTLTLNKSGVATFTKSSGTITAAFSSGRHISFVVPNGTTLDMGTNILNCAGSSNVDFTVNSGGTVRFGDPGGIVVQGTSAATGNVQTSSTSVRSFSTSGNYEYTGTAAQVTGNGLPATVNNLTINNSAGVTNSQAVTVNGILKLASGLFDNSVNQVTLGPSGSVNNTGGSISQAPLPVELISFNASVKGKNVELKWNTATETNNAGFEVERKTSDQWNKIGFVEGNGTTNTPNEYRFVDAVHGGMTYSYRLKQIDRDGKFEYSPIVEATTTLTAQDYQLTQNYPNPFNPSTTFSFAMKNAEQTTVKVYNLVGQEVATLFNGIANPNQVYTMKFDGKDLSSGIYFYSLRSGSRNEMKKMMLLK